MEYTPGTGRGTGRVQSPADRTDLFVVITLDEAEQIITAARHTGDAAAVIDALAHLVDRAARHNVQERR